MQSHYTYEASAHWRLHERGVIEAQDIPSSVEFAVPPEFGGESGYWTPEHLLLAAVASCYVATFRGMSEKSHLEFESIQIKVEGVIEKKDGYLCFTRLTLHPQATIYHETDQERTRLILEKAERGCLIMRSLEAQCSMQPTILVEAPVCA
jgi:peroxiredoxin-like protein